jgi:deoxyribonuclease-1
LGNHGIRTFDQAKKELEQIYATANQRSDVYCGCPFRRGYGHGLRVDLNACHYESPHDPERASRIEWEHAVPASAFGHSFTAWRDSDPKCVDARGKRFHGRLCARMASAEFARTEADLHNLFPVVGEVNGLRSDLPMGVLDAGRLPHVKGQTFRFGGCESTIEDGVFLPRAGVRGDLARAYKYMNRHYPEHRFIDEAHRAVFDAWDREDPPDAWERERNQRIKARQGNGNEFIEE